MTLEGNIPAQVEQLIAALQSLRLDDRPRSPSLAASWNDIALTWPLDWARAFGRDLRIASSAIHRARTGGDTDDGEQEIEHALWRVDSAFEKFHDLVALGLGVPALRLRKDRKGVWRFASDRKKNRKRLGELEEAPASALLELDERIAGHRALALRHQATHSLAPIRAWKSLLWFELAEVDDGGGVTSYQGLHLTPAEDLQGEIPPGSALFARSADDVEEIVGLLLTAAELLADVFRVTDVLPAPQIVWRVTSTGDAFLERDEAADAARAARDDPS